MDRSRCVATGRGGVGGVDTFMYQGKLSFILFYFLGLDKTREMWRARARHLQSTCVPEDGMGGGGVRLVGSKDGTPSYVCECECGCGCECGGNCILLQYGIDVIGADQKQKYTSIWANGDAKSTTYHIPVDPRLFKQ